MRKIFFLISTLLFLFSCKKETIKPIEEEVTRKDSIINNDYYYYRIFTPPLDLTNKELDDSFEIDYGKKEIIKIYNSGTDRGSIYVISKIDTFHFSVGNVSYSGGEKGNIKAFDTINNLFEWAGGSYLGEIYDDVKVYARAKDYAGIMYDKYPIRKYGWMSFDSSDTTFFLKEFYFSKVETTVLAGVVNDTK